MKPRLLSAALLLAIAAFLPTASAPASTAMPACRTGGPAPTRPPDAPPSLSSPGACQARPTMVQRVTGTVPGPGYHHLGATTRERWSGVQGRMTVRDPGIRAGSFDFVATRFMAKSSTPKGVSWLEAGWAETGWSGGGRQRVYTYDTNRGAWAFYDQYQVRDGDRVWIYLQTEQDGPSPAWQAWLWWGDSWHLLTSQELPITGKAQIEQYVEVHADPRRPARTIEIPMIGVDNVQLRESPAGGMRYWRDDVPTAPGSSTGGYCLDWGMRYDTWAAGSCRVEP